LAAFAMSIARGKGHSSFYFQGLLLSICCILIFDLLELTASDPSLILLFSHIDYAFIALCPVFWVLFSVQYSMGRYKDLWPLFALLSIVPIITTVIAFLGFKTRLLWESSSIEDAGGISINVVHAYGPWFWVHFAYSYGLFLIGAIIAFKHLFGHFDLYRRQATLVFAASSLPLLFNTIYVLRLIPGLTKDFSAIALSGSGILFTLSVIKYKLLELNPPSRERLVEYIDDGLILVDDKGRILDINSAASRMLIESDASRLIGFPLSELLPSCPEGAMESAAASREGYSFIVQDFRHKGAVAVSIRPVDPNEDNMGRYYVTLRHAESAAAYSALRNSLSIRELEIAQLLASELPVKKIADMLFISENTVKTHVRHIYKKTGTRNRHELAEIIRETKRPTA
jgi:DNA-binding CsgD family transcriptional regulator